MARLLVVEDDATMRSALVQILKTAGYGVESAENGLCALEKASKQSFDLIVSDIRMPGMDGVVTASRMKESFPRIKTILITGYSDDEPIVRALNLGVDAILKKPFALKELLRMVSLKLEEKEREDLQVRREGKYRQSLSKIRQNFGEEKIREILGDDFALSHHADPDEIRHLTVLVELGRMAELRQEVEVAIQAYEQGLALLSGSIRKKEECPIRLALSHLFGRLGETELALYHGQEALSLAQELSDPDFEVEAQHHLARIFLDADLERSLERLTAARLRAQGSPDEKNQAVSSLLFCALWFRKEEKEKAKEALREFLSFGKRHFLCQALLSLQDVCLLPFLLNLEEGSFLDDAFWVLEEAAPFIQDRLNDAVKAYPHLSSFLNPFLSGSREDKKPAFEVFGFGRLTMFLEGRSLLENHWKSLKGRSLFLYLVHEYPKLVSEEHLLDMFWPTLDAEKGRHAFRTTLYFIRRTLGAKFSGEFLHAEKQKYGIRAGSHFTCDFLRFRDFFKQAKTSWEKGDRDRAALLLSDVEKTYTGDLLQGWSEEWALNARERFRENYTWVLMALAAYHRRQKEWHESLLYSKKAVGMDPTLEEAHSFSIECLLEIGKRDEAVKQFHACKEILKSELNVPPSETVRGLYLRAIDARPLANLNT